MEQSPSPNPQKQLVLVYLPEDPGQALEALGYISEWAKHLPSITFDALCCEAVKPLARHCPDVRLVVSFIEPSSLAWRDVQQGSQLRTFDYSCILALTTRVKPLMVLRQARVTWTMGWRRHLLASILLSNTFKEGDWRGLWSSFSPQLPYPAQQPMVRLKADKGESRSSLRWLGLDPYQTVLVITETPLSQEWVDALNAATHDGVTFVGCGTALKSEASPVYTQTLTNPYEHLALTLLASLPLVIGNTANHHNLACSFGTAYIDANQPPPPNWVNRLLSHNS